MDRHTLNRYNRRLADLRGKNPHGDALYRWIHSRELFYPIRQGAHYGQMRQCEEDRWLIAMWHAPMPEHEWKRQFPDIGYPAQGMYYATDLMLVEGVEPNDEINEQVAKRLKETACRTFKDCLEEIQANREKRELAQKNHISDCIDDACVAFNNVPGKRGGHVSFGGVDAAEPSQPS